MSGHEGEGAMSEVRDARSTLIGKRFPVLDKGHVVLLDCMGSDHDIVDAARISYGKGTKSVSDDRTLIRYLMRHKHSSPFEMAEIKIGVRVPMDTWRQWIRHRAASVNEYSTRYSEAIDDMQETDATAWRLQSTANRQGSEGDIGAWPDHDTLRAIPDLQFDREAMESFPTPGEWLTSQERNHQKWATALYRERLAFGVAREQARKDLPLSTYTEAYWKCDLRNVLGFLSQRMDSHAQHEIRQYATVIGEEIVAPLFPLTWRAFRDYTLDAVNLTSLDIEAARKAAVVGDNPEVIFGHIANKREREECRAKLVRLGLLGETQP